MLRVVIVLLLMLILKINSKTTQSGRLLRVTWVVHDMCKSRSIRWKKHSDLWRAEARSKYMITSVPARKARRQSAAEGKRRC